MGKLVAILGACAVVTAGAGYAMYTYRSTAECRIDAATCPVAAHKCCGGPTDGDLSSGDEANPAVAVAGPAALFATVPVKAEASCCATKATAVHTCCADAPTDGGLQAVAGIAATMKK